MMHKKKAITPPFREYVTEWHKVLLSSSIM